MLSANVAAVIRVPIPIDVGTVAATACDAFALATPIRIDRLLALAVAEALGARAPGDKRARGIRETLAGFASGRFVLDVDGKIYRRLDEVAVCSGIAKLRFYSTEGRTRSLEAR